MMPVASPVEQEVLGPDERVHVRDAFGLPARWVCAVDFFVQDPARGRGAPLRKVLARGSGVLIGPRHLLTAAHLFDGVRDAADPAAAAVPVAALRVSPARNGRNDRHPLGSAGSRAVYRRQPYTIASDYALVVLDRELGGATHEAFPGTLGWWGRDAAVAALQRLDPARVDGGSATVIGYPGDRCGTDRIAGSAKERATRMRYCAQRRADEWASTPWRSAGALRVVPGTGLLLHHADTFGGQSGAPLCMTLDGALQLVAVHGGAMPAAQGRPVERNRAARVTRLMLADLCRWINADARRTLARVVADRLVVDAA